MTKFPITRSEFEKFCRYGVLAVSVPTTPPRILCRILGGKPCYVLPDDICITPHLIMGGFWEPWISIFLITLIRPGWRWADIGANVGYFSLLMHDLTHGGEGYAWEPNPEVCHCLRDNLIVNGSRAKVFQAVVDVANPDRLFVPEQPFHISPRYNGGSSLHFSSYIEGDTDLVLVPTDSFAQDVEVLKIDAEGHDLLIATALENPPPHIILEYAKGYAHVPPLVPKLYEKFHVQAINYDGTSSPITPAELDLQEITALYLKPK